jgi:protoheme IX farnesyltransferase
MTPVRRRCAVPTPTSYRPLGNAIARAGELQLPALLRDYIALMKPRILILLLVTGYAAMWVAAKGAPPLGLALSTMVGLGLSCGGANAINMWWDRDIDSIMSRTRNRPLPAGRLTPREALTFGVAAGAASFLLLGLAVNWLTACLSLAGLLFYVCVYTMWLKRSTVQNIVIGGAAGAVPPLVGWAAVAGQLSWAAVVMFLVVFIWTPPHFWALALFRNDDYRLAGVPMLPVVKGEIHTKWQILLYATALIPTTAAFYWSETVDSGYLWTAVAISASYVWVNWKLLRERLPEKQWAVRSFALSILYLGLIFLTMAINVVIEKR